MSKINNTKILLAALAILVMLNVICLYTIWSSRDYGRPLPRHNKMMPPGGPKSYIIKELGMNQEQVREYSKLVEEHRRLMRETNDEIRALKRELYSKLSEPEPNASEVDKLTHMIAEKAAYLEQETFVHFQKVRAICDDNQKRKFDSIIDRVIDMMSRGGPPPPPPPPPPPGSY